MVSIAYVSFSFIRQLRKITLLTRAERSEVPPERDLLPYLPDAMRRLVRAGAKMSAASVRNAKNELMSKPLDYVVLRLEEQLRGTVTSSVGVIILSSCMVVYGGFCCSGETCRIHRETARGKSGKLFS